MKQIIFILISFFCSFSFAQSNYDEIINKTIENHDKSRSDSIVRALGYKGGDKIKVYAIFQVNSNGEIHDIRARGPHKHFEEEAIRVVSEIPKLDPNNSLKEGQSMKYTLPITFVIETDAEKKKRERKEQRKKEKNN
ncbi:hypothetical protein JBL43_18675 [Aureibaculum sp. A20]|uniref:TonB C-terminal domain-containing protein n=1 Tax=Aureibaculum flavum TaxID=2795986 RepID=A0ABS0WWQ9_9FLAO|nr:hypothetical protein [Aureibaculum flavum]MBJ2176283.1 hypothetical protein [Aureibaculum flavum]